MHSSNSITGMNEAIIRRRSVARSAAWVELLSGRRKNRQKGKNKKNVERRILKASERKINRKQNKK